SKRRRWRCDDRLFELISDTRWRSMVRGEKIMGFSGCARSNLQPQLSTGKSVQHLRLPESKQRVMEKN
ncbi:MAG: hypothetical protein ABI262_26210, partial [Microcoleus sp.]